MKHLFLLILLSQLFVAKAQNVEILGDLKLVNGTQGEGKVLVSDVDGVASWITKDIFLIDLFKNRKGGAQILFDFGYSPLYLWQNGVAYDSIVGVRLPYDINSGFRFTIAKIDTAEIYPYEYKIVGAEGATLGRWGCDGLAINGANSLTDGMQNLQDVLNDCPVPPNPAHIFIQILNSAFYTGPNWYIASQQEAQEVYDDLIATGKFVPEGLGSPYGDMFWTSTEASGANEVTHAMMLEISTGTIIEVVKSTNKRAITMKEIPD